MDDSRARSGISGETGCFPTEEAHHLNGRVILVDAHETSRTVCRRVMRAAGWYCHCVGSTREALAELDASGPDSSLLVLDTDLKEVDPWPILERAREQLPPLPVVVLTSMGEERIAAECMRRGAVDYVLKGGQYWDLLPATATRALEISDALVDASRLAAVVEASPDPIFWLDLEGRVRSWNRASVQLYRRSRDGVLGRPFIEFVPEEDQAYFLQQFAAVTAGQRPRGETRRLTATGEVIPVTSALAPICSATGRVIGAAVTEQDLRPHLAANHLRQISSELTKVNQELDQFAAVAAHDLQSPLRVASLSLDLLSEELGAGIDPDAQQFLDDAMQALQRSGVMVNKILDYARQATTDISKDREISLARCCEEAVANLSELIDSSMADIELGELPLVRFDPTDLVRILQNLIGNALKYRHPERRAEVRIRAVDSYDIRYELIEIADNGLGMSADDLRTLFRLFSRGSSSRDEAEGTGIGLAVCKKLVEARGGRIQVRSELGVGTVFSVALPSLQRENDEDEYLDMLQSQDDPAGSAPDRLSPVAGLDGSRA